MVGLHVRYKVSVLNTLSAPQLNHLRSYFTFVAHDKDESGDKHQYFPRACYFFYKHLPEWSSCLKGISKVSINESLRPLERDGLTWKTISGGNIEKSLAFK